MTTATTEHRRGAYGWATNSAGVNHFRVLEPLRVMAQAGYPVTWGAELDNDVLSTVDTVVTHMLHQELPTRGWHELARGDTHRLVLDVDDAMWAPDWAPFRKAWTPETLQRLYSNLEVAHVVTTPSPVLADHLARYNRNVHVVPNTVPQWLTTWEMPARDRPVLGYQGSPSHTRDWTYGQQVQLSRFLARHPDWGFHAYGHSTGALATRPGVVEFDWERNISDYYRSISMDVGIGPLADTRFNRSKSSIRAVEYGALGIVAVLPVCPAYTGWVKDGDTGRLIYGHQTLSSVLAEVAADEEWRKAMSKNARHLAQQWTTENNIWRWVEAWDSL